MFYRICEEALRNTQKHAGDVRVTVQVHAQSTTLADATAINDEGQIVANNPRCQSYLLTPASDVPEPSTWGLLGIPTLLLLGWSKWRSSVLTHRCPVLPRLSARRFEPQISRSSLFG